MSRREVAAHALDAPQRGDVVEREDQPAGRERVRVDRELLVAEVAEIGLADDHRCC